MIVATTVQEVAAQTPTSEQEKNGHEEKYHCESGRPYVNLLKDGTSTTSTTLTPPLFFVQKKLVAPGPGLEPVEVLEAVSPRCRTGLPQLIRAVPYAQRSGKGANTRGTRKPRLRPKPLTQATVASLPKASGQMAIQEWLASMDLPAHTEFTAIALASEGQYDTLRGFSDSDVSNGSTVGGHGGTFANAFRLGIISRLVGRRVRRKPFRCVRAAAAPLLHAFRRQTALAAGDWPVSYPLTSIQE